MPLLDAMLAKVILIMLSIFRPGICTFLNNEQNVCCIDYERIVDKNRKRMIRFGKFAG